MSFNSATMRAASFGPTPGARETAARSCSAMALARSFGASTERMAKCHLGADPLHGEEDAEPVALGIALKAEEADRILANLGFYRERD